MGLRGLFGTGAEESKPTSGLSTCLGCPRRSPNFLDGYTSYKWRFLHATRYARTIRTIFDLFLARVNSNRLQPGNESMRIARFQTDNGKEITSELMQAFMTENHIIPEATAPHKPSQNGTAEGTGGNSILVASSRPITANTSDILQGYAIHFGT